MNVAQLIFHGELDENAEITYSVNRISYFKIHENGTGDQNEYYFDGVTETLRND